MKLLLVTVVLAVVLWSSCSRWVLPEILTPVPDAEAVGIYHTVKHGETLSSICSTYHADLQEVAEANGVVDANILRPGQRIFIPDVAEPNPMFSQPTPSSGEHEKIQQWEGQFIWPVHGVVTSQFGVRNGRRHDGIDIAAPQGTEIRAAADGSVLYSGDQQQGYGNLVIISHTENMITVYAHNQQNLVEEGIRVKQGQVIARVGKTGRVTGSHVHFEIRKSAKPRNPLFFLPRPP